MKTAARLTSLSACVLLLAASSVVGCEGRSRSETGEAPTKHLGRGSVAEIDLTRGEPESAAVSLFGPPSHRTHWDLIRAIQALEPGDETKAVFVRFGGATFGLARAQEIGALFAKVRAKVPVICHADDYNNASMFLAAMSCTKIWVSPAGGVDTVGIAAQMVFGRSLFDKYDVTVDFLQVGKFKGAEEPFTRDGPSPEARKSLEGALGGLRATWLDGITTGRSNPALAAAVEDGPYGPEDAKKRGLVDAVGYLDDAKEEAKKLGNVDTVTARFGGGDAAQPVPKGLGGVMRAISGSSHGGAHVALVPAVGAITMAPSRGVLGGSDGISERELGKIITKLTKDAAVKAVVVRIDSPGGSALASDLLWAKLMKLRKKKTLVFSIGGMAASGGYYLSCTANKIIAEPGSIVGSIGVVGGKLSFGKTAERYGVHAVVVPASPDESKGARAAYMSPLVPWDDATRERMLASMTSIYDLFLARVAEGRGITVADVAPSAEGQIFGGIEAKRRRLVDELGGLDDAVKIAKKLANLPEDTPVDVVTDSPNFVDVLEGSGGGGDDDDESRAAAIAVAIAPEIAPLVPRIRDAIAASPELATLSASIAPMLAGEHTLTAMPFGIVIR